jgi:hypothetical protein
MRVDHGVTPSPGNQPPIHWECSGTHDDQCGRQAYPEQGTAESGLHRPGDDEHDGVVHDLHDSYRHRIGGEGELCLPSTSPIAQPVRQCTVALNAVRLREGVRLGSHSLARLGATPTLVGALLHHLVATSHPLAVLGTGPAHLGTDAAGPLMEVRATKHEVGARLTDFSAVQEQPDMGRVGVPAP